MYGGRSGSSTGSPSPLSLPPPPSEGSSPPSPPPFPGGGGGGSGGSEGSAGGLGCCLGFAGRGWGALPKAVRPPWRARVEVIEVLVAVAIVERKARMSSNQLSRSGPWVADEGRRCFFGSQSALAGLYEEGHLRYETG